MLFKWPVANSGSKPVRANLCQRHGVRENLSTDMQYIKHRQYSIYSTDSVVSRKDLCNMYLLLPDLCTFIYCLVNYNIIVVFCGLPVYQDLKKKK